MKIAVVLFIAVILFALGTSIYHLLRRKHEPDALARALVWRLVMALFLFILLVVAYTMGWINLQQLASTTQAAPIFAAVNSLA